jgi:hypothetical protein
MGFEIHAGFKDRITPAAPYLLRQPSDVKESKFEMNKCCCAQSNKRLTES